MEPVQIIPSSIAVGKVQTIVVVFPCEIPQDKLITLELSYNPSPRKGGWSCWVPGQPLGIKSLLAKIPEVPYGGDLDVLVKVSRQIYSPCPKFQLEVLSPLQTVLQGASTVQKGSNTSTSATSIACLAAYLLHTHEKDQSALSHDDKVVCGVLQSQPSFGSDWNLSSLIFGKYGHKESLLHLFVRCKLEGAVDVLLQRSKGKEAVLQQKDYKGRTPAEIARKKGSKRIVEIVDAASTNLSVSCNYRGLSRSLEQDQFQKIFSSDEDIGPLPLKQSTGVKQMFHTIRNKRANDKKQPPSSPLRHHLPIPLDAQRLQSNDEPLQQLLSRKLYTATVLLDYHWEKSPFADAVSLKRGDIVHVIKELGNDLCQGVCNDFYCTIPKHILLTADMTDDELSDDYEEVLDPINISDLSDNSLGQTQFPTKYRPQSQDQVVEMQFRPPALRLPIKTHDQKPLPVPGRLLPDCKLSSSHDSGLDRLGMPQQFSRGDPQGLQELSPISKQSREPPTCSVLKPVEEKTSTYKPAKPPAVPRKHRVLTSQECEEVLYDNAITLQQDVQEQLTQSLMCPPPVKSPVVRCEDYPPHKPVGMVTGARPHKQPIAPPRHKVLTSQESDEEEYDDTSTLQQNVNHGKEQLNRSVMCPLPVKPPVARSPTYEDNPPHKPVGTVTTTRPHKQPIAPPKHEVLTSQESDEEEYDDTSTLQRNVNQGKEQLNRSVMCPLSVKSAVARSPTYEDNPRHKPVGTVTATRPHKQPIAPPKHEVLTSQESDEEEYDDTSTLQQNVNQQLTQSVMCPPPVKSPVARPHKQPIPPPRHRVPAPPEEVDEEEYDDASSIQQRMTNHRREELPKVREHLAKPPVKIPVARAASCGGQARTTPPIVKPRNFSRTIDNQRTPSPPIKRKPLPVPDANGHGSSIISDLQRHFEHK